MKPARRAKASRAAGTASAGIAQSPAAANDASAPGSAGILPAGLGGLGAKAALRAVGRLEAGAPRRWRVIRAAAKPGNMGGTPMPRNPTGGDARPRNPRHPPRAAAIPT
jgi:hypothetical protein